MTPVENVVRPNAVADQDVALAERAASSLIEGNLAYRCHDELKEELLTSLRAEKEARERLNLNHWHDYAPRYMAKLVRVFSNREAWRRRKIAAFYQSDYAKAHAFAAALLPASEVQDVVAEAFARLLEGRTKVETFYRTLHDLCVDRLRKLETERKYFVSLEQLTRPQEELIADDESLSRARVASQDICGGDPLVILMDRRNRRAKPLMVGQAKRHAKWRYSRRKNWAKPLQKSCAETAPSNG